MVASLSLYLFLSSFLLFQLVIAEQNGFGFKIIHRDSPESPLYPGNLTLEQRLQRFHNQTNDYISHVASVLEHNLLINRSENTEPTWIRPPVSFKYPYYITIIGIGTFTDPGIPYKNMYVMIDTGSDLIWTQCENCRDCFPQNNPLYPYTRSSTYQNLPCNRHPLCYPGKCEGDKCSYIRNYAGNAVSQGYVSRESFTFNADNGATEVVTLVFGCGFDQKQFNFGQNNPITGILGLGNGPRGLLNQLGPIRSLGRMSYCIPHYRDNPAASSTFLRFGADAQFKPDAQLLTTQLIQGPVYPSFYYVDLLDISVAGRSLDYPPGTFGIRSDGKGGTVLDSGSPLVFMEQEAYDSLKMAVAWYFVPLNQPFLPMYGMDLCYSRQPGTSAGNDNILPTITFHFPGADLDVTSGAFLVFPDYLCLAIVPHQFDFVTVIIGNLAQSNHRFLFNVLENTVTFAKEECKLGS